MPRTKEIEDAELLDRLMDVFRSHGYEGASLSLLSEATGIGRASLYHRFPGGKPEMAEAVLEHAGEILDAHVLTPLGRPGDPVDRIRAIARGLEDFYAAGRRSCLLDTLSFGCESEGIESRVATLTRRWVNALARVSRDAGLPASIASARAEDAIARIQGALVLARATGRTGPFERAIDALPRLLTEGEDRD